MGTITKRDRVRGGASYLAQVTIKRGGKIVHREAKTFDRKPAAAIWLRKREAELKAPGAAEAAATERIEKADASNPPLSHVIELYVDASRKTIGKTKSQVLTSIQNSPFGECRCREITSSVLIQWLEEMPESRGPATMGNYLSHLASVAALAGPAWNVPLSSQAFADARVVATKLGMISKSRKRERRPSLDELGRILNHLNGRIRSDARGAIPMTIIVMFAIMSTRRLDEICRMRWADYEPTNARVLVRDMKNPGQKLGNDVWVTLPPEAMEIIKLMPRSQERIFPYNRYSISAAFTRTVSFLGIEDLHFHDLRHDGISRLFEMGGQIPTVATVSGHKSWSSLQRYTHIRQSGDKYATWPWRQHLLKPTPRIISLASYRSAS